MFSLEARISGFAALGEVLVLLGSGRGEEVNGPARPAAAELERLLPALKHHNGWFTEEEVRFALRTWGEALTADQLTRWLKDYPVLNREPRNLTVSVITAGNLPLVGFHDVLCILLAGFRARVRQSSEDHHLLPAVLNVLGSLDPRWEERWEFAERINNPEAVIATGSNNSARYFESYFAGIPHLIRKNRNSVAVLDGSETDEEMEGLAEDIFRYFGLGCRSVAHVYIPRGFDTNRIFQAVFGRRSIIEHGKYANNYDYYRAFYLLNRDEVLDNGFFLLKRDEKWGSPVAVLHYTEYDGAEEVKVLLEERDEALQCVVTRVLDHPRRVDFGRTQTPALADYADGVDTLAFLSTL